MGFFLQIRKLQLQMHLCAAGSLFNAYLDWKNFGNENVLECNCQIKFLSNNVGFLTRCPRTYYIMAALVMSFHVLQVLKSKKIALNLVFSFKYDLESESIKSSLCVKTITNRFKYWSNLQFQLSKLIKYIKWLVFSYTKSY